VYERSTNCPEKKKDQGCGSVYQARTSELEIVPLLTQKHREKKNDEENRWGSKTQRF